MSEYRYVEQPILGWLCGEPKATYGARGLGWTYRDQAEMAAYERSLEDPLVEKLLVPAILRINPIVKTEAQAKLAVAALRKALSQPDPLVANRKTLDLLRDGAKIVLELGTDATTVQFIAFEPAWQNLNDFTATNQYRVLGVKQCREDTVLLVNGIPLVVAEYKSYVISGKDWREAVHQLHRYQRQAPAVLTPKPLLRRGGRGGVPLRHGALPRREQRRHRATSRLVGPLAEPLSGALRVLERAGGIRPGRSAGGAGSGSSAIEACASTRLSSAFRGVRDEEGSDGPRRSRDTSSSRR